MSKHTNSRDVRDDGQLRRGRKTPRRTNTRAAAILAAIKEG